MQKEPQMQIIGCHAGSSVCGTHVARRVSCSRRLLARGGPCSRRRFLATAIATVTATATAVATATAIANATATATTAEFYNKKPT